MKLVSSILFFYLMCTPRAYAQIGIGTITPDPNALLDLESTTQGVLIPRMTSAQRDFIASGSPTTGLLIYQIDDTPGFYYYDGTGWVSLSKITPSGLETIDEGNGDGLIRIGRNAMNYGNIGENAVDLSYSTTASTTNGATGFTSTAMGRNTEASGPYSVAMGADTKATGSYSTAIGRATISSGTHSTAMGVGSIATGNNSTAIGRDTQASGDFSLATGFATLAESYSSTAIGYFNVGGGNPLTITGTDPLFEIGNGNSESLRSNAMTVLRNGNIGIGTPSPSEKLDVVGNAEINGIATVTSNLQVDNTTLFVNASNNRVGIGTTIPSQALDVVGNAEINGNTNVSGDVNADGYLYGKRTAFSAYQNTSISLSTASSTFTLPFSDVTDPFNSFNGNIFTAPRDGLYFFSTSVSFDNGDGQDDTMWMGFSVNNASPTSQIVINPRAFTSDGREHSYSHTMVLNLISGQNVRIQLLSVSGTTAVRVLERTFTGFYLGEL